VNGLALVAFRIPNLSQEKGDVYVREDRLSFPNLCSQDRSYAIEGQDPERYHHSLTVFADLTIFEPQPQCY
jgi:hypothetical protein